jgi:hypothetical protein
MVNNDFVPDAYILNICANRINNPGYVAATYVKVVWLSHLLSDTDHVDWDTTGGPDVVEIDPCRHCPYQNLIRFDVGDIDLLHLKCSSWITKSVLSNHLCKHLDRDLADSG